jgi:hypothetical protein
MAASSHFSVLPQSTSKFADPPLNTLSLQVLATWVRLMSIYNSNSYVICPKFAHSLVLTRATTSMDDIGRLRTA